MNKVRYFIDMKFLETAFAQLTFAWKLYNYVLEGKINLEELDIPITFQDKGMVFVLPSRIFKSNEDLILACENNLTIAFGAAAITLNRSREEAKLYLPNPIETEQDQFIALVYQIRNAFAHDIAEPLWQINLRYRRIYRIGKLKVDLTNRDNQPFDYESIGGIETIVFLHEYGKKIWGEKAS